MVGDTERKFYDDALAKGEQNWQKVGYGIEASQTERFETLFSCIRRGQLDNCSLLDVGCGLGDLHNFLDWRGWRPAKYVGIDTNGEVIAKARQRVVANELLGKPEFYEADVHEYTASLNTFGSTFDVVCSIAALAFKEPQWGMGDSLGFLQREITRMCAFAEKLVFVTVFSSWSAQLHPLGESLYVDPSALWSWAMYNFDRVDLFHSYAPHDFALAIWMDEGEWWRQWRAREAQ